MKIILTTLLLCLWMISAFAQIELPLERLYLREKNAAGKLMKFEGNRATENYNVTHYNLHFTVDPSVKYIEGVVTTTFTAKEELSTMTFDFDDSMTVNKITYNGLSIDFTQTPQDELNLVFPVSIPQGQSSSVIIEYEGNPTTSGFGSYVQSTHNGTPVIWTLSEPFGAKTWWPCKQNLTDKADSIDVFITAPEQYTSVSNGIIESVTVNDGMKTTHWDHDYPIPAYLIAIAVTNYVSYSATAGSGEDTFPVINYVYPEWSDYIKTRTGVTVPILNFYGETFGLYPYHTEKYGHCQFGWGGGMEHTTISFMGGFSRGLIAHEMAHQWFGDKVTCGTWQDIWLNEGFASYLTAMVIEEFDGEEEFDEWKKRTILEITSEPGGSVYVPDSEAYNRDRIFNSRLSYSKGAIVLHMLRKKLGDSTFFQGLRSYLNDPDLAYGFARTSDLKRHLESASGLNLGNFFQDWVYNEGYPIYEIQWTQKINNDVILTFNQTQSHPSVEFFEAPVNILFNGAKDSMEVLFNNTFDGQVFTQMIPFEVESIVIDPHNDLIAISSEVTTSTVNSTLLKSVNIYPNPVAGKLFINTPSTLRINSYIIHNTSGELMKSARYEGEGISTSNLKDGIYIISLSTSQGNLIRKFVKQ